VARSYIPISSYLQAGAFYLPLLHARHGRGLHPQVRGHPPQRLSMLLQGPQLAPHCRLQLPQLRPHRLQRRAALRRRMSDFAATDSPLPVSIPKQLRLGFNKTSHQQPFAFNLNKPL
jgi:hypothetical protein